MIAAVIYEMHSIYALSFRICLLLTGSALCVNGSNNRTIRYQQIQDIFLRGGSVNVTVESIMQCSALCTEKGDGCVSVSYNGSTCQLNTQLPTHPGTQKMNLIGWTSYYKDNIVVKMDCRPAWPVHNGSCYYRVTEQLSWINADAFCKSIGGHLAEVRDVTEAAVIFSLAELNSVWIGLTALKTSGKFEWSTGGTGGFIKWYPGGPSANSGYDCVYVFAGVYYNTQCKLPYSSVCKLPK